MDFTGDDARSLAEKLEAMELTEAERAALDAVFEAASDEEVSGFGEGISTSSSGPALLDEFEQTMVRGSYADTLDSVGKSRFGECWVAFNHGVL